MTPLLAAVALLAPVARGEYRVYQYYVMPKNPAPDGPRAHLATSTLDPVSYRAYHGGEEVLEVDLLRTWICFGVTSGKDYCPPPLEKLRKGGG